MALHDRKLRTLARYRVGVRFRASGPFPAGGGEIRVVAQPDDKVTVFLYRPDAAGRLRRAWQRTTTGADFRVDDLPPVESPKNFSGNPLRG